MWNKSINLKNTDDKGFKCQVNVALNYEEIESNIKPFTNKYKWKEQNHLPKMGDWKTVEKNNSKIVLNILYIKVKEICPPYISKYNSKREKKKNSFNDSI